MLDGANLIERVRASLRSLGRSILNLVIGGAVAAVVTLVIGARVSNFFSGPDAYKIYVAGKLGTGDELKELFDAIPDARFPLHDSGAFAHILSRTPSRRCLKCLGNRRRLFH
jgi:hypothetical protein